MTNLETFITCIIYYVYDRQRNACMDIDIKNQLRRNIDETGKEGKGKSIV